MRKLMFRLGVSICRLAYLPMVPGSARVTTRWAAASGTLNGNIGNGARLVGQKRRPRTGTDRGKGNFLEKTPEGYRVANWEEDQGHIWRNHVRAAKAAKALHRRETVDASSRVAHSTAASRNPPSPSGSLPRPLSTQPTSPSADLCSSQSGQEPRSGKVKRPPFIPPTGVGGIERIASRTGNHTSKDRRPLLADVVLLRPMSVKLA